MGHLCPPGTPRRVGGGTKLQAPGLWVGLGLPRQLGHPPKLNPPSPIPVGPLFLLRNVPAMALKRVKRLQSIIFLNAKLRVQEAVRFVAFLSLGFAEFKKNKMEYP